MKRKYFSPDSIQTKSLEMYEKLESQRMKQNIQLSARRSALLILDMQAYFLEPSSHAYIPSAETLIPNLQALIDVFAARDLPVIFTQHLNTPQDAGQMGVWWRDTIKQKNPLSRIIPELDLTYGTLLQKSQYDAFYHTPLEGILKERSVTQVVICGVITHLCCETTARSAFMRGFDVFFTIDGTATYNDDHHMATLLNLAHGFAIPILVREIMSIIQGENGS